MCDNCNRLKNENATLTAELTAERLLRAAAEGEISRLTVENAKWYKEGNEFKEAWRECLAAKNVAEGEVERLTDRLAETIRGNTNMREGLEQASVEVERLRAELATANDLLVRDFHALRDNVASEEAARADGYREGVEWAMASLTAAASGPAKVPEGGEVVRYKIRYDNGELSGCRDFGSIEALLEFCPDATDRNIIKLTDKAISARGAL